MNLTKLRKLTNEREYQYGSNLYHMDAVSDYQIEEISDSWFRISARVDKQIRYRVYFIYNSETDSFESNSCNCSFGGARLCRHCVAAMMKFLDRDYERVSSTVNYRQLSFEELLENENRTKEKKEEKKTGKIAVPALTSKLKTSVELKKYLDECRKKKMEQVHILKPEEEANLVKLQPMLTVSEDEVNVQFKIGITQLYVLKDIEEFLLLIEKKRTKRYGKNLCFVHNIDNFTQRSRKLVAFIRNWKESGYSEYDNPYSYSYYYYRPVIRELNLNISMLEDLLEIMQGTEMYIDWKEGEKSYQIKKGSFDLAYELKKVNGGARMTAEPYRAILGNRYNIFQHKSTIYLEDSQRKAKALPLMTLIAEAPGNSITVSEEDIPDFCREFLPVLSEDCQVVSQNFDVQKYQRPDCKFELYLDEPQNGLISCKVLAVYSEKKYNVYEKVDLNLRNEYEEMLCLKQISDLFNAFDERNQELVLAEDDESIFDFLKGGIEKLKQFGTVFVSDRIKRMQVIDSPKIEMGISLTGDLLELSLTSKEMTMQQLVEILSKYQQKRKFYKLKSGAFVVPANDNLEKLSDMAKMLGLSPAELEKGQVAIPKYRAFYMDQLDDSEDFYMKKNQEFRELILQIENTNVTGNKEKYPLPARLKKILRPYQRIGFGWLKTLSEKGFGGILADDMGLGKTLQMIAYLLSEFQNKKSSENRRTLIVCPASLVFNWKKEFEQFAEELKVHVVHGSVEQRQTLIEDCAEDEILITSYDTLKRDIEYYDTIPFCCQIIDEAQYIKNHNTLVAKAVKKVNAVHRFALTGTPIENRVSELWSIFDYLMPGILYSYNRFHEQFEVPIMMHEDKRAKEKLRKMVGSFILRRLKKDVLKELPEKLEEMVVCQMEAEQQKLYDAHVQRLLILLNKQNDEEYKKGKIEVLSEITKLRQLCCDPALLYADYEGNSGKRALCMETIKRAIEGEHKVLVFSQFTSMLDLLKRELEEEGLQYYLLTGATQKEKRIEMVEKFNQDEVPVFLISLKAGGTGLNLTGADIVIHYDPWWNIAVQNQATDRAHRIGQKNPVTVYKLVMEGTIEEKIVKLQQRKQDLAEELLGGAAVSSASLSRKDLMELLR